MNCRKGSGEVNMKYLNLSFVSLFFVSCAHFNESPKTVDFPYAAELVEKVQMGTTRAPASMNVEDFSQKSPRRIYFSALYHQYLTLGRYLGKKSEVSFCPQFHHDKVETDSGLIPKVSMYQSSHVNQEGRDYFPELAFSKKFSLRDYHGVIHSELVTLCEEGISDNFYKFDNLVTHYSHKAAFHQNPKAMTSVLKIPVFANYYLVKMLEIPGLHFTSPEEKQFIKLTNTYWFENYVAQASRMREQYIKNKMVRR
jgi:hypothetical protein